MVIYQSLMFLCDIFKCLSEPTRLRIVNLLIHRPLCVCHIQKLLGLSQVSASKHLAYLKANRLVEFHRHQQWMIYSLPAKPNPLLEIQLSALKKSAVLEKVLKSDIERLQKISADCRWVESVLSCAENKKNNKENKNYNKIEVKV